MLYQARDDLKDVLTLIYQAIYYLERRDRVFFSYCIRQAKQDILIDYPEDLHYTFEVNGTLRERYHLVQYHLAVSQAPVRILCDQEKRIVLYVQALFFYNSLQVLKDILCGDSSEIEPLASREYR